MEEYLESELSSIFRIKLVSKTIVLRYWGTHFNHETVKVVFFVTQKRPRKKYSRRRIQNSVKQVKIVNGFQSLTILLKAPLTHLFPMHPFSTPWKHQKTVRFFDVFRRERKGALGTNGLTGHWIRLWF